ncbi:MAG: ABC transporter substrate-binding protein [Variibacter sp.]|nr:ABC transporter substrate-binding protein [Variibacter sp.]
MNRIERRAVLARSVAALGLAAQGSWLTGAAHAQSSGTLVVAQPQEILTLDPAMYRNRYTQNVVRQVCNALVRSGPNLEPLPELATSWTPTTPLTWEVKLRPGVRFTNGEPCDAAAVKFTFDRIMSRTQRSPRAALLPSLAGTDVVDELTVVFRMSEPTATFPVQLATQEIVPPRHLQAVGDREFARNPVGTGPFKFESWTPNRQVVFTANPDYFEGAPPIARLIFRPIPELAARIAALRAGEVHIATDISPDLAPTLTGNVRAVSVGGTTITYFAMNVTKAPFDRVEVRRAVQHAIDRRGLVQGLFGGEAEVLNQLAFAAMDGHDPDYRGYDFDPAKARAVLSGVTTPVRIDVLDVNRVLAEAIAAQLRQAGMNVSVGVLDGGAFQAAINQGNSVAHVNRWGFAKADSDTVFTTHFHSRSRALQFFTGFSDPAIDTLIEQARVAAFDRARARPVYAELNRRVMDAAPWVPLMNANDIYGVSTAVRNWQASPDGRINLMKTAIGRR